MGHQNQWVLARLFLRRPASARISAPVQIDTTRRALTAADDLATAIETASGRHDLSPYFDTESANRATSSLARQLQMVTRLIAAGRDELGLRRQVFFVSLGLQSPALFFRLIFSGQQELTIANAVLLAIFNHSSSFPPPPLLSTLL